ncbi:hypothetical protein MMC22_003697 [Lobaria immixta]|nr:hypothetical protein [Lobaria immixta]
MRLPMLSGAAFLACGILVSSRALSIRQEVQGLYGDPSWWNGGKLPSSNTPIIPLLPTLPNTNYEVASTLPFNTNLNGLPESNPQIPTQYGLDPPIAINSPPSIDSSFQTASTAPKWTTLKWSEDVEESLLSIKNKVCEYGIYAIDANTGSLVIKESSDRLDRSNWKDLSNSLTNSGPAYAVVHLENGRTLSLISFIHKKNVPEADVIALKGDLIRGLSTWMEVVQKVLPNVIAFVVVNDAGHFAQQMSKFDPHKNSQSLSVPGSFALNGENSVDPAALYKKH